MHYWHRLHFVRSDRAKGRLLNVLLASLTCSILLGPTCASGAVGEAEHFHFLPPMVSAGSVSGAFDGSLSPVVEVTEAPSQSLIARFTTAPGPDSETVRAVEEDGLYIVNWHTDRFLLEASSSYRVSVWVGITLLGYADIAIVDNPRELKSADSENSIALLKGRTLPIKFRIESGVCLASAVTDTNCNGVDDDCDGAVDEDYVPVDTACGMGACAATGATSCVSGSVIDSWVAGTPAVDDGIGLLIRRVCGPGGSSPIRPARLPKRMRPITSSPSMSPLRRSGLGERLERGLSARR